MSEIVQRIAMKAVIVNGEGKVLLLREASTYKDGTNTGRYHMPGGRVEPGENFEVALRREVIEETGLEVEIQQPIFIGEWRPVIRGVQNQIVATFIVCKPKSDEVKLSEEHDDYKWVDPVSYTENVMTPEDEVLETYSKLSK